MKFWGVLGLIHSVILIAGLLTGHFAHPATTPASNCRVGTVEFDCPGGYTAISIESKHDLALFQDAKGETGLFVLLPDEKLSDQALVNDVSQTIIAKIFPKESPAFTWKAIEPSRTVSKFETGGGTIQAYNGSLSVLVRYRHINFKQTKVIVGYVTAFGRGPQGKQLFELGLGGDSMPSCEAAVGVIYSITGEKVSPGNSPCALVGPSGPSGPAGPAGPARPGH